MSAVTQRCNVWVPACELRPSNSTFMIAIESQCDIDLSARTLTSEYHILHHYSVLCLHLELTTKILNRRLFLENEYFPPLY